MRCCVVALMCLAAAPASAQVVSRPSEPPIVTADHDAWYRQREPVLFAGDYYYPAGATVFFDRNTMIRTGHYNGVPLYADATIEPYSVVYVPIEGGRMQPYERIRRGELAGTSGSRTPSFPVRTVPESRDALVAGVAPAPRPEAAASGTVQAGEPGAVGTGGRISTPVIVGTGGTASSRQPQISITTLRRPESNDGVWLQYMNEKWVSAGPALPFRAADFLRVGDYKGTPVLARQGLQEDVIYLPSRPGFVAPYRLK
jgi:hypothetical protein